MSVELFLRCLTMAIAFVSAVMLGRSIISFWNVTLELVQESFQAVIASTVLFAVGEILAVTMKELPLPWFAKPVYILTSFSNLLATALLWIRVDQLKKQSSGVSRSVHRHRSPRKSGNRYAYVVVSRQRGRMEGVGEADSEAELRERLVDQAFTVESITPLQ